jgi:cold shock CspA family protein
MYEFFTGSSALPAAKARRPFGLFFVFSCDPLALHQSVPFGTTLARNQLARLAIVLMVHGEPSQEGEVPMNGRKILKQVEVHGRPTTGRIIVIAHGQGHGFVRDEDSRRVFFHKGDVKTGTFNDLATGDRVRFEVVEDRVSGPRGVYLEKVEGSSSGDVCGQEVM